MISREIRWIYLRDIYMNSHEPSIRRLALLTCCNVEILGVTRIAMHASACIGSLCEPNTLGME